MLFFIKMLVSFLNYTTLTNSLIYVKNKILMKSFIYDNW